MLALMKRSGGETEQRVQPVILSVEEVRAVAGGATHKNNTTVGPAPYNVHSSPAGAGPAFYNQ